MSFTESNNFARAICGLPPSTTRRDVPGYLPPARPAGRVSFDYDANGVIGLQCQLELADDNCTLVAAYHRGEDVVDILSPDIVDEIESAYMAEEA